MEGRNDTSDTAETLDSIGDDTLDTDDPIECRLRASVALETGYRL